MISQLSHTGEALVFERLPGKGREPYFHLIKPAGRGWGVMKMHVFMAGEPAVALGFVSIEIVKNDMNFASWMLGDDLIHESQKFPPPSPFFDAAP